MDSKVISKESKAGHLKHAGLIHRDV
jgi:hypothetical protein